MKTFFMHDAVLGESANVLAPGAVSAAIMRALRAVLRVLNRMGSAIQLGEAGDLEGARICRENMERDKNGN